VIQRDEYYPFGLTFNSFQRENTLKNNYLYNGKELQTDLDMNEYDFGARHYMPDLGRWGVLDPLAEKGRRWSPYAYAFDNPVRFIDPDGMWPSEDAYRSSDSNEDEKKNKERDDKERVTWSNKEVKVTEQRN
jgi:RHS repeat-associated protein